MLRELDMLLDEVSPAIGQDVLVSAGDLLDKGPESAAVVRRLRCMREAGHQIVLVEGNHEEKHARFRKALKAAYGTEDIVALLRTEDLDLSRIRIKDAEGMFRITSMLDAEDIAFLDSAVPFHRLPEHNSLVVHAGIPPTMKALPTPDEIAKMGRGERERLNQILRIRHVRGRTTTTMTVEIQVDGASPEDVDGVFRPLPETEARVVKKVVHERGEFLSLGSEQEGDPFWADLYDNRFGHVYFGHSPHLHDSHPVEYPFATGLDLGAVFGNRLAAMVLEVGEHPKAHTVPARNQYATSLWENP